MRRVARAGAVAVGLVVLLAGCDAIGDYVEGGGLVAQNVTAYAALDKLVAEVSELPSVTEAAFSFDALVVWADAAVTMRLDETAGLAEWAGVESALDAASADLREVSVAVDVSSDGGIAATYALGTVSGDGVLREVEGGLDLQRLLGPPLTVTLTWEKNDLLRELTWSGDDADATHRLLDDADDVAALAADTTAYLTQWTYPGLQATHELPPDDIVQLSWAAIGELPLRSLSAPNGAALLWHPSGGGQVHFYSSETGPPAARPSWAAVVAAARVVIEARDPRLGFDYLELNTDGGEETPISFLPCEGVRVPSDAALEVAEALAHSGVHVPEGALGWCETSRTEGT